MIFFLVDPAAMCLDQISNVAGHFLNLCVVMVLQFLQCSTIPVGDKVNSDTFTAETTTATDSRKEVLLSW